VYLQLKKLYLILEVFSTHNSLKIILKEITKSQPKEHNLNIWTH